MVKCMLNVLMDGIKDTEMLIDYAYTAEDDDNIEMMNWFSEHAHKRYDSLIQDFIYIQNKLNMSEKIRSGDAIAEALRDHLESQVQKLKNEISQIGK